MGSFFQEKKANERLHAVMHGCTTVKNATEPLLNLLHYFSGVPRDTKEARDFANFDIFDDPHEPYSSFTFEYKKRTFDRLKEMMKFNTLLNMDLIKEKIAQQVTFRKNNPQFAQL